jgi:[CysO sulfur-carrier protein]-S-L-cysteine hydrolase
MSLWYNLAFPRRWFEENGLSEIIVSLTESVRAAIEEQALAASPYECCGLLSGKDHLITAVHALRNDSERPLTNYFASPEDMFSAMRRMRKAGHQMLGIYHSHPRSKAYPSATDVQMAFYPEAIYFIISLEPKIELQAFKINNAIVEAVRFTIVNDGE